MVKEASLEEDSPVGVGVKRKRPQLRWIRRRAAKCRAANARRVADKMATSTPAMGRGRKKKRLGESTARKPTRISKGRDRRSFRKVTSSPGMQMMGTPVSGKGKDIINPGGRLKTRARALFGSAKVDDGKIAKGLILHNPAVVRKGVECHRSEILGTVTGLLGCAYCGATESGTKRLWIHMRSKHGCRYLRIACHISSACDRVFRTLSAWSLHAPNCKAKPPVEAPMLARAMVVKAQLVDKRRVWSQEARKIAIRMRGRPAKEVADEVNMSARQVRSLWSDAIRVEKRQLRRDLEATTAKARAEEKCRAVVDEILARQQRPMPAPCKAWGSKRLISAYQDYAETVLYSEVGALIKARVESGRFDNDELERLSCRILAATAHGATGDNENTREPGRDRKRQRKPMRKTVLSEGARLKAMRRYINKRVKLLWGRGDLKKAAGLVLDGEGSKACMIERDTLEEHYTRFFGEDEGVINLANWRVAPLWEYSGVNDPISFEEVKAALTKPGQGRAAGPDNISLCEIKKDKVSISLLTALFNMWLVCRTLPARVHGSRTILIPKKGDPLSLAAWRPISIGEISVRIFGRVLAARIAEYAPMSPRQQGFTAGCGPGTNLFILNEVCSIARCEKRDLEIIFLDLKSAFNSIPHVTLIESLKNRGADKHFVKLIRNMHKSAHTYIEVGDTWKSGRINIQRGILQGGTVSPILYNLATDPLLRVLESQPGFAWGKDKFEGVSTLAFADDLALIADTREKAEVLLGIATRFYQDAGLKLNVGKCAALRLSKGISNLDKVYTVGNDQIKTLEPGEVFKYLGAAVPVDGLNSPARVGEQLSKILNPITNSKLPPDGKIILLEQYGLPRLQYNLVHGETTAMGPSYMEEDRLIREAVKRWCSAPTRTVNGVIYAPPKAGGLGVTELGSFIPSLRVGAFHQYLKSPDPVVRSLAARVGLSERIADLVEGRKLGALLSSGAKKLGRTWRDAHVSRWEEIDKGVGLFSETPCANNWIRNRPVKLLTPTNWRLGLMLRSGGTETKADLGKRIAVESRTRGTIMCRHSGCGREETLAHVLGGCKAVTSGLAIARHDDLVNRLELRLKRKWCVYKEKDILSDTGELRRPDLVCVSKYDEVGKPPCAYILDVFVAYDDPTLMDKRRERKLRKYSRCVNEVHLIYGVPKSEIVCAALGFGARGSIPGETQEVLKKLGVWAKKYGQDVGARVVRGSCAVYRQHMNPK